MSLSESSRRMGSIDLADSTRYFDRASRLMMAFRVRAGTPLRSMSIEVAVDEVGGGADGAACASRGGSNTPEKRMEEATNADVTAVTIGRVISSRGWKRWLSSSRVAWMDEFCFPIDDTSRRWSNNFPDGRVNAKHVVEEAVMAMAASAMDGKDGMVNLLRVHGYFQMCDNNIIMFNNATLDMAFSVAEEEVSTIVWLICNNNIMVSMVLFLLSMQPGAWRPRIVNNTYVVVPYYI